MANIPIVNYFKKIQGRLLLFLIKSNHHRDIPVHGVGYGPVFSGHSERIRGSFLLLQGNRHVLGGGESNQHL